MNTLKRLHRKHVVVVFLAVMLALGLAPAGAFAASAADAGSASRPAAGKVLTRQAAAGPVKVFVTVSNAEGAKTFSVDKWTTIKAKRYFTVNEKTDKVTAKKGTPKGTYNFKVKVTAKGNKNFMGKSTTKFVRIVAE